MTDPNTTADVETTGLDATTSIEVEPDRDGPDQLDFAGYASPAGVTWQPTTVDSGNRRGGSPTATAWRHGDRLARRDGGTLHVITAAARTPAVGLVASYEGSDLPGTSIGLADGMAIRVVTRLDKHEVAVPDATIDDGAGTTTRPLTVSLRYLPAAALTNPRAQLGVILPDDWNAIVGGAAGFSAPGLEHEVNALEVLGLKIRHRLFIAATPSSGGVHFGTLAERIDLHAAARDVLRAGGMVQVEAGAMTPLDAVAAVGIPPWAGWINRFDMTIVVPCTAGGILTHQDAGLSVPVGGAQEVVRNATEAVRAAGGPATAQFGTTLNVALVDAHKVVPGVAGWTTDNWDSRDGERWPAMGDAEQLIEAVGQACDGEVDVEMVGTGPGTLIDLR